MKKIVKVVAILFGIFVLLLVAGTLALKIFFPAEKVKALLLKELTAKLHREVAMDQVSLGLIKGLEIEHLRVSESKTFAQGTFVSVDKLDVRVRLLPLLSKKVEVDTLVLSNPKISVTRAADGKTFNFSDLLGQPGAVPVKVAEADCKGLVPCAYAAPGEPSAGAPPVNLQISKLDIQSGQVHFVDHSPAHQNADIDDLNLKVGGFSLTDFFNASLRAKIQTMGMTVIAQASAKLNLQTSVVQLTNATLTIGESKIEASGQISDYASAAPTVSLTVLLDALTPASFGALAGLPPALSWNGPATGNIDLHGDLAHLDLGGNLHLDNVQLRYGKLFEKPAKAPFSFSFNGNVLKQSTADIHEWGLKLGTLSATGSARVDGLAQKLPSLSLHVVTNEFSTTDLLALLPGMLPPDVSVKGPMKIAADVTGTPASYKATAKVSGQDLIMASGDTFKKPAGMPFEITFNGESVSNGERLNIQSLLLELGRIQMTLSGQSIAQGKDARLTLALHTNDFPLDEVSKISPAAAGYQLSGPGHLDLKIGGFQSAPSIDGTLTLRQASVNSADLKIQPLDAKIHFVTPNTLAATARLTLKTDGQLTTPGIQQTYYSGNAIKLIWNLADLTQDQAHISGTAQFTQGAGVVRNAEQLVKEFKTTGIVLVPFEIIDKVQSMGLLKAGGIPALAGVPFDSLRGDYVFQPGTLQIHAFDLVGHDLSLSTTGSAGMGGTDPSLNLSNQVKLPAGSGGGVGDLFRDDQGRPVIKFAVTGTQAHPSVKLDLGDAGKNAVKKLFQGVDTSNPNQAIQDIGNNLKNLFK